MSAELYQMISLVAFISGGILTLVAIILFIKFDIPSLIGELSGRTAEKKVQEIREQNRQAASMRQRGSERRRRIALYEVKTETPTDALPTGRKKKEVVSVPVVNEEATAVLEEATTVLDEATEVLNEATEVLNEQTEVLYEAQKEVGTTLLNGGMTEDVTTILSEDTTEEGTTVFGDASVSGDVEFSIMDDVLEIHTEETI